MSMREYVRDNQGRLLLHLAGMALLCVFLLLTGTAFGIVLLILLVWAPFFVGAQLVRWRKQTKEVRELWAISDGLPQKYLLMECAPKPGSVYAQQWFRLMRAAGKSMIEEVSAAQAEQREYREYIENWVHEIKVPITTIQLICENNRTEATPKILLQLAQIEEQVERALYYARSSRVERDFVVRRARLADVAAAALAQHRTLLIQNGVRVETDCGAAEVYTDAKWLEFIIGQLLSNAVKYKSAQPLIRITAAAQGGGVLLCVEDNGIGIPAAELPRVFDKGFTGSNGRVRGGATGMGLYLCKKLAAHLDIALAVDSAEAEFTRVTLHFPVAAPAQS